MAKLNSSNKHFLKEKSIPYLISKDGSCQIYLGKIEDSEILRPTEADKEEAEKLIESLCYYFKIASIVGMLLALIMYIVHSIDIVLLVGIIEIIMVIKLYLYQKKQNDRIMHLISIKIPIESGSKDYIMILEPIHRMQ
jgi:Flp pilus assembly protein TadB